MNVQLLGPSYMNITFCVTDSTYSTHGNINIYHSNTKVFSICLPLVSSEKMNIGYLFYTCYVSLFYIYSYMYMHIVYFLY